MRILLLCSKFPYPARDGGAVAMMNLIKALHHAGHDVTVFAMNTPKHGVKRLSDVPESILKLADFYAVNVDTTPKVPQMIANFFLSKEAYHVERFTSEGFAQRLAELLEEKAFDVIQMETLYMTPYLDLVKKMQPDALCVFRAHNIENEIWRRKAQNETNPFKRTYLEVLQNRLKSYEINKVIFGKKHDAIIMVSDRDSKRIRDQLKNFNKNREKPKESKSKPPPKKLNWNQRNAKKFEDFLKQIPDPPPKKKMQVRLTMRTFQIGTQLKELDEKRKTFNEKAPLNPPDIFYLGALDWLPNKEGLDWFLKKVWPKIHKRHPDVKFYIAGRNMGDPYINMNRDNIIPVGEVEDAFEYINKHTIMVVPLLSGSGMRVKIVEGMAMGKAIVATKVAMEGIQAKDGDQCFIADKPNEFADRISIYLENHNEILLRQKHARAFAEKNFDNDRITQNMVRFFEEQLKEKRKS